MTRTDLPPAVLWLVAAGRRALASAPLPEASASVSPETLTEYARRHGMLAWTAAAVRRDAALAHVAHSLAGLRQLVAVVDEFERNGIPVVALKGPALSQWLYGDAAARRFSDLDLLVTLEKRDAARRLLEQQGFERRIPAGAGDVVYASIGAWPMVGRSGLPVDLHWTLAGRRFAPGLMAAGVVREATTIELAGRSVRIPRAEHAAVITLTHSAKHLWYALELPFSIATLTRRADIDWLHVRDLSERAGALRAAAAGLALAADLFGVDLPAPFADAAALADARELCRGALTALALPPGIFPDRRLERRIHLRSFDRAADRLRYDVRRLMEPTRAEWEWLPLPSPLARLYWPARLLRVATLAVTGTRRAAGARNSTSH